MTKLHSSRPALTLLLLTSAAPGCNLIDKYCVGDCPEALTESEDDDGGSTAVQATGSGETEGSGESHGGDTTDGAPNEPPGACEIVDTITPSPTCDDGVQTPGEMCLFSGGGSFGYPNGIVSIAALQLDAVGQDLLIAHQDGAVHSTVFAQGPGLSPVDNFWDETFGGELQFGAAGDFNEDGALDIVAHLDGATDKLQFLELDGAGGLALTWQWDPGAPLGAPQVADFDDDGHVDVVVPRLDTGDVIILKGEGTGNFLGGQVFVDQNAKERMVLAAFGADGVRNDFVFALPLGELAVRIGDSIQFFKVGQQTHDIAVADVDGDGHEDIIALVDGPNGASEVTISRQIPINGDGQESFVTARFPVHCGATVLAVGDVDADGVVDVVTASPDVFTSQGTILRGDGDGGVSGVLSVTLTDPVDDLIIVDLNGDEGPELVTMSRSAGALGFTLNSP